ncbi:MAG: zinc dependent phospholipase C family protein [Deltaproteobacteria bacterium]
MAEQAHRLQGRAGALLAGGCALALVLLWPAHAYAWGPLAHLEFGAGALENPALLPQGVFSLLSAFTNEYLYGTLAADMIVGKNLSRYAVHCHNWQVGFDVLRQAESEPQRAFAYGFLAHLACDTIAHNYYVPYKTVQSYDWRRRGHAYWELRYDQRLDPELWRTARRVSQRAIRRHDTFLRGALAGSSVLPFGLSRRLFGGLLLSARLERWQKMSALVAREHDDLPLHDEEVRELRALAVGQIVGILRDGTEGVGTTADPTGLRNLRLASDMRHRFRVARSKGLSPEQARETLERVRPAFRDAIHGPLQLPHLDALYA